MHVRVVLANQNDCSFLTRGYEKKQKQEKEKNQKKKKQADMHTLTFPTNKLLFYSKSSLPVPWMPNTL